MGKRQYDSAKEAELVLKEALWLAWTAAGGPQGMGVLQDNPQATKDQVWDQAYNMKDYSGRGNDMSQKLDADYVFGRMLKLRVSRPTPETLVFDDYPPRPDYQSWCNRFRTFDALFDASEKVVRGKDNVEAK
jgi:hypothetical protein